MDINYERNNKVKTSNLKIIRYLRVISKEEFKIEVEIISKL
jgi:hypothetical protein